jgi:maltokinase
VTGATSAPVLAGVEPLLRAYLERQTWYWTAVGRPNRTAAGRGQPPPVAVSSTEVLRPGPPHEPGTAGLGRLVVESGEQRFQVVLGWREAGAAAPVLDRHDAAILGAVHFDDAGELLVYDALADRELLLALLPAATAGRHTARRARIVESRASHASIIYDDRLFMKLYRILEPPPRPEVEVLMRLDDVGCNHVVAPVALWRGDDADLALVREFFPSGVEGYALALTSLRDLLAGSLLHGAEVAQVVEVADESAARAGGDLASEIRRLGSTTARLHLALATAFGEHVGTTDDFPTAPSIRVHGDYHLRRVMRTDAGWVVVGFGDDPLLEERLGPRGQGALGTPLEDVADLCFSLAEVADEACAAQGDGAARARPLADAWARRNTAAFVEGYLEIPGILRLLPPATEEVDRLLDHLRGLRAARAARTTTRAAPWRR